MDFLKLALLNPVERPEDKQYFNVYMQAFIDSTDGGGCETWSVQVESLAGYQRGLENHNETVCATDDLILKEYNEELIAAYINKWIAECNSKSKTCDEARRCLMQYMEYEYEIELIQRMDKDILEQARIDSPAGENITRSCYKLDSISLASGKPHPDDFEYCDEEILLHYKKIGDDHEITLRGRVMTVGWLERMLEKEPIVYMPGVSVMRFFDIEVLKLAYAW